MPLTDAAIRALKPEAKRYSRTDERGLVIEVFPTGGMLWHYRYRVNGKPERVTLGRYPALSLRQARLERDRREALVAQGQSPAAQKRLTRQGLGPEVTVAEFGERFFRVLGTEASGSGLGWSIVRRIAQAHGATVRPDRSPMLGGLRVTVDWPAA